jgi:hypothetical protein
VVVQSWEENQTAEEVNTFQKSIHVWVFSQRSDQSGLFVIVFGYVGLGLGLLTTPCTYICYLLSVSDSTSDDLGDKPVQFQVTDITKKDHYIRDA